MKGMRKITSLALVAVLLVSVAVLFSACDPNDPDSGSDITYTVTSFAGEHGKIVVSPAREDGKYPEGTEITVKAVPDKGYELMSFYIDNSDFTDRILPKPDGYSLKLYRNREFRATFQEEGTRGNAEYKYAVNLSGFKFLEGEVTLQPARSGYKEGEQVTVSIRANSGYQFGGLTVDGVDHKSDAKVSVGTYSYSFTIGQADVNVNVSFTADLTKVFNVTDETFDKEVVDFDGVVLIDCWAIWCEWCEKLSPIVDQLAKADLGIKIVRIETDYDAKPQKNPRCIKLFNARSLPLLVIYKNGKLQTKQSGLSSYTYAGLYSFVEPYLPKN